jgi:hypothetical protein
MSEFEIDDRLPQFCGTAHFVREAEGVYTRMKNKINHKIENQLFKGIHSSKSVYPIFKPFYLYVFVKNGFIYIEYQCKCLKNATQNIILCLNMLHFFPVFKGYPPLHPSVGGDCKACKC